MPRARPLLMDDAQSDFVRCQLLVPKSEMHPICLAAKLSNYDGSACGSGSPKCAAKAMCLGSSGKSHPWRSSAFLLTIRKS
mmetsp:Transcript_42402/g.98875  ORF Transcript_42402/g.98875 Transcript_42402/m.98875 type:complete len:81 (+) Transcript_42402:552-794(+)